MLHRPSVLLLCLLIRLFNIWSCLAGDRSLCNLRATLMAMHCHHSVVSLLHVLAPVKIRATSHKVLLAQVLLLMMAASTTHLMTSVVDGSLVHHMWRSLVVPAAATHVPTHERRVARILRMLALVTSRSPGVLPSSPWRHFRYSRGLCILATQQMQAILF